MTLFLASVANAGEAQIALRAGADILDAKDAAKGALGALDRDVLAAIVATVAGSRPVSAVTGDLPMIPSQLIEVAAALAETGLDYVKVGLFPDPRRPECIRALAPLARTTRIIGVMFADLGADPSLLPLMAQAGLAGAMLDTAAKRNGRLLDHWDVAAMRAFIGEGRAQGLMCGLAGSLETPDIPRLLRLEPDVLGFRGALCVGQDRAATLEPDRVRLIRDLIPRDPRGCGGPPADTVDYSLLAARGYAGEPGKDDRATDRIFIRDWVLPIRVGAYAHERATRQRVRFNVDADVMRAPRAAEDMRDVVSYDLLTDGIRLLVDRDHIPLLETLAENIAALVLSHPRVLRVRIALEKLDLGPGSVGIEITRERSADVAKVYQLYPPASPRPDPKVAE
jgi:(5-formylfuran-3-yl)methyl phosphate synthase